MENHKIHIWAPDQDRVMRSYWDKIKWEIGYLFSVASQKIARLKKYDGR